MLNRFLNGHSLTLLWFAHLMNVTEEVTIHRPNVSTLLSSAFIRGDLNAATRGPFIWSLIRFLNFRYLKLFVWKCEVMGLEKMARSPLSDFTLGLMFLNIKKGVMWRLTSCKWANDSKEGEIVVQWWNNIRIQSLYGSLMKQFWLGG